jgi:hypothetical protein
VARPIRYALLPLTDDLDNLDPHALRTDHEHIVSGFNSLSGGRDRLM